MKLNQLLFLATLLALTACATAGRNTAATSPAEELETSVQLPQAVGKLEQVKRQVFDDPALGIGYSYAGDMAMQADVYVYPLSDAQMTLLLDEGEETMLTDAFNGFRAELAYVQQAGKYESYSPRKEVLTAASFDFRSDDGMISVPFLVASGEYDIRWQGRDLLSFAYLTEFSGYIVKVRITNEDYPGLAENAADFVNQLIHHAYVADAGGSAVRMENKESGISAQQLPGESVQEFLRRGMQQMIDRIAPDHGATPTPEAGHDNKKAASAAFLPPE